MDKKEAFALWLDGQIKGESPAASKDELLQVKALLEAKTWDIDIQQRHLTHRRAMVLFSADETMIEKVEVSKRSTITMRCISKLKDLGVIV